MVECLDGKWWCQDTTTAIGENVVPRREIMALVVTHTTHASRSWEVRGRIIHIVQPMQEFKPDEWFPDNHALQPGHHARRGPSPAPCPVIPCRDHRRIPAAGTVERSAVLEPAVPRQC